MKLTLLLDLDDTLIGNDMDTFLPAYLHSLGTNMQPVLQDLTSGSITPQSFIQTLMHGTQRMLDNNLPDKSLETSFAQTFYPALGINEDVLRPYLDAFYRVEFPKLCHLTSTRPQAADLLQVAFAKGWQVVIATNPLFPRQAVIERLRWAGLPPEQYPYALITSYEQFHFAKPNPAYLAEVLMQLGCPDGPVLMVGNDLKDDILPARALTLPCFWVPTTTSLEDSYPTDLPCGELADVLPYIESQSAEALTPAFDNLVATLALWRAFPAALQTLLKDIPESSWTVRPASDQWSINEIICHLRDVDAEVNRVRIDKVLTEENPFLPGADTDPWAASRTYIEQNGRQALHSFVAGRTETLQKLDALPKEHFARPARHAIFGPTHLGEILSLISAHDRQHMRQIKRNLDQITSS